MQTGMLFTQLLAVSTLLGNAAIVILLLAHVFWKPQFKIIMRYIAAHGLFLAFVLALAATIGSWTYGQVMGYAACILCWIQRIFMYPLPFLLGLAIWRGRDRSVIPYALFLTLCGAAVALYQWIKDMLALYAHISVGCPVVPGLPSCDRMYVLEFGYVTIPMIALNAFLLIAIVLYASLRSAKFNDD